MAGLSAFGTQLKRNGVAIAGVANISGPGMSLDTEDVTAHDSPGGWEEVVATILRSGEVGLEINYDPNAATHKNAAAGLIGDMVSRQAHAYDLVFPTTPAVTWSFNAFVTGFEPGAPADGKLTADVTLKPTGQLTLA